jgi:hypothetical protein
MEGEGEMNWKTTCSACSEATAKREIQNDARAELSYSLQRLQNKANALKTIKSIRALRVAINRILKP